MKKNIRPHYMLNWVTICIVVSWVSIILGSLFWNIHSEKQQTKEVATHVAKAYSDKDLAFRLWGAKHGGVYAPVSDFNPPNPFLAHIKERDIETPSGKKLTLINPAYMIRQMMGEFSSLTGVGGHLTSLNLLNPINTPDAWEKYNLEAFAKEGVEEIMEFVEVDGELTLRMMRPFFTKKPCLKCHAHQGYKVGDIRGATTMSIPMGPYLAIEKKNLQRMTFSHTLLLCLGLVCIMFGYWRIRKNINLHILLREELKNQNDFIHSIIESLTHPFFVFDAETLKVELANSAALNGKDISGQTCFSLSHNSQKPCEGNEHPCPINYLKEEKIRSTVEHIHFNALGQQQNVEIHCYPVLDADGKLSKIIEFAIDITNRRTAEREKYKLQRQLQQAQKMESIGTLAGGIAHDFNNILTPIYGYVELALLKTSNDEELSRHLNQVKKAAERAREMVKQILTFSRRDSEALSPTDVHIIVKEALKLLRASIPTTIEIRQDINPDCGWVQANPTKIHQVLINLCTNAYHAMRETGGILGVSLQPLEISPNYFHKDLHIRPGSYLHLEISDTGHGMSKSTMDKIFEPYFTTKNQGEGTGMGLSVVHGIVKSLDGHISVYSEPGEGTNFHIYLPVIASLGKIQEDPADIDIPRGTEHIMVVDDEETVRSVEEEILEGLGYEVTAFTDPQEALDSFKANPEKYDLIITDMTMPKITGDNLAVKLMEIRPNISVILCTGFSDLINEKSAKALGIKKYITKPIIFHSFARAVRNVLDGVD